MTTPRNLAERRSRLSPAQRALFEKRLRGAALEAPAAEENEAITPREEAGPAAPSHAQRRLWDYAEQRPGSSAHNVFHAVGLAGPLDRAALVHSLAALVERHEALRTRFERTPEGPAAVAVPTAVALPTIDLSALPGRAARDAEGVRLAAELAGPPFDLARGPLLRTALVASGAAEHAVLLAIHHIVVDGWSLALFVRELAALYDAFAGGRPSPLPPAAPLQSADFAAWQHGRLAAGALDEDLAWWRARLAGAPAEGLRWPGRPGAAGGRVSLALEPPLAESLRGLAQRERATPFIALLALFKAALHRRLGADDLVVGTPFSLRGRPEAAGLFGFLLNLLALRTRLDGDPTFRELLARVRDTALGAFSHREVPFERLAEELCPGREPGSTPWVRVLFNMPTGGAGHPEPIRAARVEVQPLLTGEVGSEFDLTFYAREVGGGIRLDLGFNAGLLAPGEAAALLADLAALAAEAVAAPERRLSELLSGAAVVPARAGG